MFGYFKYKYYTWIINNVLNNQNSKKAFLEKASCLNKLGNTVSRTARIMGPLFSHCNLYIGDDTFIGTHFHCEGNGCVKIGRNCDIAPQVTILTGTHNIGDSDRRAGKGITTDVLIGDGTWIGACCVILPGVHIGRGCVIGAGAVVTHDVPDDSMALGIPAKITPIKE